MHEQNIDPNFPPPFPFALKVLPGEAAAAGNTSLRKKKVSGRASPAGKKRQKSSEARGNKSSTFAPAVQGGPERGLALVKPGRGHCILVLPCRVGPIGAWHC